MINHERRWELELLRIVSCVLVIFNHTAGFTLYKETGNGYINIFFILLSAITTLNVPVFFMISGMLLLNKDERYDAIIKRRFCRILSRLCFFILILYIIYIHQQGTSFSIKSLAKYIIGGPQEINGDPYWFLYSYLALLIILPIVKTLAKSLTESDFRLLIFIHIIICSGVPVIDLLLKICGKTVEISHYFYEPLSLAVCKPLFYSLIGYYLDKHIDIDKKCIIKFARISVFSLLITVIMRSLDSMFCGNSGIYVNCFDYVYAMAFVTMIFYLRKNCQISKLLKILIVKAGGLTFGIYLTEPVLRLLIGGVFGKIVSRLTSQVFFHSILWCIFSFLTGAGCTFIMKWGIDKLKSYENKV